jgi:hypothetical protein
MSIIRSGRPAATIVVLGGMGLASTQIAYGYGLRPHTTNYRSRGRRRNGQAPRGFVKAILASS